jgi:O-acetyl-ADP-ribose deacetylase (regulator of RNase III)
VITYLKVDIFTLEVDCLVNPVNCEGVMGRGLALQFKRHFPSIMPDYTKACLAKELRLGKVQMLKGPFKSALPLVQSLLKTEWIANFPTKDSWRNYSRIEWIEEGLTDLRAQLVSREIASVAIPPLGCGLGGLAWNSVKRLIETTFESFEGRVLVLEP